ncbi:hypothetical protein, partial [Achromobacter xylosoxidans]|uniref:hypothetical protein n=1 Tax=Alcaligenes xylosoxydans xylosoxydans TaxID=85698 RepID=UPI003D081CDF
MQENLAATQPPVGGDTAPPFIARQVEMAEPQLQKGRVQRDRRRAGRQGRERAQRRRLQQAAARQLLKPLARQG